MTVLCTQDLPNQSRQATDKQHGILSLTLDRWEKYDEFPAATKLGKTRKFAYKKTSVYGEYMDRSSRNGSSTQMGKTQQRPGKAVSASLQNTCRSSTTGIQLESQLRWSHRTNILIEHATRLIIDINDEPRETRIEYGVWHQQPNKQCNCVLAAAILVADGNATYIVLCTGVVVIVHLYVRCKPSVLGVMR